MSGNNAFNKSMNGIVSLDTGGTTIEGGNISSDTIDCNILNATTVNTTTVDATTVDATTVNASIVTNNISQLSSASSINFFNILSSSATINMFSDITNIFGGIINICCGAGVQVPTINILKDCNAPIGGLQFLNIGDDTLSFILCKSFKFINGSIIAVRPADNQNIFLTTTGDIILGRDGKIKIGNTISITNGTIASSATTDTINLFNNITTGTVNMCNSLVFSKNSIASTATTDVINLFNNISGTIGKINMAGKFIISEGSIASTSATDSISLFNNINTVGEIKMANNLLFKQNNILSTGVNNTINLFTNITTGTLNFLTGLTTGTLNIGDNSITSGNINIGGSSMTGNTTINKSKLGPNGMTIQNSRYGTFTTGTPTIDANNYTVTHGLGSTPLFAYAIVDKTGFSSLDSFTSSINALSSTTITFTITRVNSNNTGWGNNYTVRWFAFN